MYLICNAILGDLCVPCYSYIHVYCCACTSMYIAVLVPTHSTTTNTCSAIFATGMCTGVQVHPFALLYVHKQQCPSQGIPVHMGFTA